MKLKLIIYGSSDDNVVVHEVMPPNGRQHGITDEHGCYDSSCTIEFDDGTTVRGAYSEKGDGCWRFSILRKGDAEIIEHYTDAQADDDSDRRFDPDSDDPAAGPYYTERVVIEWREVTKVTDVELGELKKADGDPPEAADVARESDSPLDLERPTAVSPPEAFTIKDVERIADHASRSIASGHRVPFDIEPEQAIEMRNMIAVANRANEQFVEENSAQTERLREQRDRIDVLDALCRCGRELSEALGAEIAVPPQYVESAMRTFDRFYEQADRSEFLIGAALFNDRQRGGLDGTMPGRGLELLLNEVIVWARDTFPEATAASCAAHLKREVSELVSSPTDASELADCAMLVVHAAHRAGVDLTSAIADKLQVNKAREWGAVDSEGVREHVDRGPAQSDDEGLAGLYRQDVELAIRIFENRIDIRGPHGIPVKYIAGLMEIASALFGKIEDVGIVEIGEFAFEIRRDDAAGNDSAADDSDDDDRDSDPAPTPSGITRTCNEMRYGVTKEYPFQIPCTQAELSAAFDDVAKRLIGTHEAPGDLMPAELNPGDHWTHDGTDEIVEAMWNRSLERDPHDDGTSPAPRWVYMKPNIIGGSPDDSDDNIDEERTAQL